MTKLINAVTEYNEFSKTLTLAPGVRTLVSQAEVVELYLISLQNDPQISIYENLSDQTYLLSTSSAVVSKLNGSSGVYATNLSTFSVKVTIIELVPTRAAIKAPRSPQVGRLVDWSNTSAITGFSNAGEGIALDPNKSVNGKNLAKINFATAGATLVGTYTLPTPVYIGDLPNLIYPIMCSTIDTASQVMNNGSNDFQVWLNTSAGQLRWRTPIRAFGGLFRNRPKVVFILGDGTTFTGSGLLSGGPTDTNFLNSATVTSIILVCLTGAPAASQNVWMGDILYGVKGKPNITMCFDAQYISQYTAVRQILAKYGILCNFALSTGLIGTGGRCDESQLNEIYNDGHYFLHHSGNAKTSVGYGLASDWATSANIAGDIAQSEQYRKDRGWTRGLNYGVHAFNNAQGTTDARNDIVLAGLKQAGMLGMRAINVDEYGSIGIGLEDYMDPYMVQSPHSMGGASSTAADVIAIIDRAIKFGKSAVITGHELVPDSATPAGNQLKIGDFNTAMAYLRQKMDSGAVTNLSFPELVSTHYGNF